MCDHESEYGMASANYSMRGRSYATEGAKYNGAMEHIGTHSHSRLESMSYEA